MDNGDSLIAEILNATLPASNKAGTMRRRFGLIDNVRIERRRQYQVQEEEEEKGGKGGGAGHYVSGTQKIASTNVSATRIAVKRSTLDTTPLGLVF